MCLDNPPSQRWCRWCGRSGTCDAVEGRTLASPEGSAGCASWPLGGPSRVVHVQTNLLHGIGDVRLSKHQVLESSYDAPELGGILYWRLEVCSKPRLNVDWSRACLAINHGRTLNDVQRVSALVKK
jgi:hypothetical protein